MTSGATDAADGERYAFRFDAPLSRWLFGDRHNVTGWLIDLRDKPILGLRVIRASTLRRKAIFTARRKRDRPHIAVAFPHLVGAISSGFLVELELAFGRNVLTFQAKDENRVWHTFAGSVVYCWPLKILRWLGLQNVRDFVIRSLQRRYLERTVRAISNQPIEHGGRTSKSLVTRINSIDLFATSRSNLFILEIGELVAAGFRELGFAARLRVDEIPSENPRDDCLQLVVTPHEYYNLFLVSRVSEKQAQDLSRHLVLLCTEQPDTGWFYNNLIWARHARAVADISSLGAAAYRSRKIKSYQFQLGYDPTLAADRSLSHVDRTYDISFLGSMTPRRDSFFAEHAPFFAARACHLRFVPLSFAKTDVTRSYLPPDRRNCLLADSRILLSVHYSEQPYFEWHRTLVGLANGCCVVSETAKGHGPLVPGRHFVMADPEDLIPCCEYYLNHPVECETIARQGAEFVRTHLRQSASCQKLLDELSGDSSDLVSYPDSEALKHPRSLRRSLAAMKLRRLQDALGNDLRSWFDKPRERNPTALNSTLTERETVQLRRSAYRSRWQEQEQTRQKGETPWAIFDNQAYARAAPAVSVVVTLFNYAEFLEECVASVAAAAARMPQPVEIVIVNDASTDDSLAKAFRYQQASSLPVRVIDKKMNTGLADTRNIGTTLARSTYVFMMDADNLLYPDSLRLLWKAIQEGNQAAAYSLLCRFKGDASQRTGLLSQYDWDPQILVQQPYIDAMALFRRDVLLQLNGYDNDLNQIGWFGWEDYDLWLQFAQRGLSVAFVPNILCLYRQHDRSMINTTNLFEMDLVSYFLRRYAKLVNRFEPQQTLFGVDRSKIAKELFTEYR